MKDKAVPEPAARSPLDRRARPSWERAALERVARHVAELDCYQPQARELGWESAALERLRSVLRR
jgi:hypothetical protein